MNVSYRWLKELAPTIEDSATELAERLTYTAVPVDDVVWLGEELGELVIGKVLSVAEHPNADKLVICKVDIGRDEPVQVVTGAPVVVEGGFYPYVGAGQTLPGGLLIKKRKMRGEPSEGMLCSERELGIGRDAAGIMQLHGEFEAGQPLLQALELDDYRLDVDVTPNRPDLLGHWGVARELAPGGNADLRLPDFPGQVRCSSSTATAKNEGVTAGVTVRIEDPEGCPRYMGAVIRGVTIGPSPEWLGNRLRAIGQQPINNVVDATNYVLHELNQPLHAFDLATLSGPAVVIRRAQEGERLRTLDGNDRVLDPEMLVIADAEVPTAMAGLMGGEATEVTDNTRDLFLECAYFEPRRVRRAAKGLALDTDASFRFQRGIDPDGLPRAMQRLIELILTLAGGSLDGDVVDVNPRPSAPSTVTLRPARVGHLLGVELDPGTIKGCLEPIGFQVGEGDAGSLEVEVPTWRPDIEREVDLIEEVARRHGYDRFPAAMRTFRPTAVREDEYVESFRRLREVMIGLGFLEAKTTPFVPEGEGEVRLLNPLSEPEDHLRADLLTGLIHRVEHNLARGQRDIRLFELGTAFGAAAGPVPTESIRIAATWTGGRAPSHWLAEANDWDVWDLKWILGTIASLATPGADVRPADSSEHSAGLEEALAVIAPDGRTLGRAGRLPAARVDAPPWAGDVWALEVEVTPRRPATVAYSALPVHPAVERDLALLVEKQIATAEVGAVIRETGPTTLESLSVFDVYEGENLPQGTRSVAWRLRFRAADRTLTDEEVDQALGKITSALQEKLNVAVRGA
ncbi:MAG: phenylalanine--tRNA ligase subunit beta [Gemmatimonadetes bacterium]|nr:phenylalanine--tRNA ligase subunit beta [Gemmatimonadota bacterium]NIO33041.1 phenylalanine--tRNA ligase subunit beta [Gemmatimonadota bacterium]